MGCCAHHHHHVESGECHAAAVWEQDLQQPEAEGCDDGHNACGHHEHNEPYEGDDGCEHPEQSPCDGSHDCDEPSCSFIAAAPETLGAVSSLTWLVAYIGERSTSIQSSVSAVALNGQRFDDIELFRGARAQCILFQSWQI